MKKFLIYALLLLATATAQAQNFPVQSTVFIAPPYSVYLSDYASASSQKMMVNLLLKDVLQQGIQVKLRVTIKGNGIELRSKPEFVPPPIVLTGGVPLQVSGTDLEGYLLPANLNFSGLDKQEFLKTGKLPEGVYQFMVEAVEYRREVAISNQGMTIGWLVLNDPPRWTLPMANSLLTATYPQNVFFSWMPMNTSSPNSAFSTEYEFTLVEIWPADRNPNDAINSTVPLFQTTTNNTSLLYDSGEPELTPGRKYVCRLRAKDAECRDLFKNHGYSETLTFTFGMACKPPNTINHTVQSDEQARVDWISLPGNDQFILSYSEKNNDGTWSNWYNNETMMPWSNIEGMKPDHTYRYRLQATCGTLQSGYSETKEFNTPKKDTAEIECGKDLSIPVVDGSPPLQNLKPGDMINVGGFDAKVYEASGSNGTFSGKCVVHVKTFKFWVQSEFTDIGINQSMQVTSGTINAIKGKLHLLNIDAVMDSIKDFLNNGDNNNGNPNVGEPYVPGNPITVIIDGETIVVTGDTTFTTADGTEVVVTLSGQPPIIIVDGKTTEVTTDVLDFDNPGGGTNDNTHLVADSSQHSINYVQFKAYEDPNGNHFGFDAYPPDIPEILSEYKKEKVLDKDYIIPWQSAEANGKPALVNMLIDTKVPDSIQTRLKVEMEGMPLTFTASPEGDTIKVLNLTGQGEKDRDLITASYLNDEGKEVPIGFLNLISYKKQELKLVIVPVDVEFKYNASVLQNFLNRVYAPAITTWNVSLATEELDVEYDEGDKNGLNTSRSFLSSFNKEMNAIIDAMKARSEYSADKNTYYLFVMDKAEKESLNGLMPFSSNFGFIFTGDGPDETKLFRTMAHELGHGAFKLKHIFDDKGTQKQATLNLMDYTSAPDKATVLHKYQWDEIIDPRLIAFGWSEESYAEVEVSLNFEELRKDINLAGGLKIIGNTDFRRKVESDLAQIMATDEGRKILATLNELSSEGYIIKSTPENFFEQLSIRKDLSIIWQYLFSPQTLSMFWATDRIIYYSPYFKDDEIDGGYMNSYIILAHELYHAYQYETGKIKFVRSDKGIMHTANTEEYKKSEEGAVAFANGMREIYNLLPLRKKYTGIDGFHWYIDNPTKERIDLKTFLINYLINEPKETVGIFGDIGEPVDEIQPINFNPSDYNFIHIEYNRLIQTWIDSKEGYTEWEKQKFYYKIFSK